MCLKKLILIDIRMLIWNKSTFLIIMSIRIEKFDLKNKRPILPNEKSLKNETSKNTNQSMDWVKEEDT